MAQKPVDPALDPNTLIARIKEYYDLGITYYAKDFEKIKILDLTDNGQLWQALGAKFPDYQILPDSNFITYVKSNLVASLYTVGRAADLQATSENDKELVVQLNSAMSRQWSISNVAMYQFQAGEWAALTNIGITQVGWDNTLSGGSDDNTIKGNVALKNIDPIKFMRDPFASSLETAGWCMTYDVYHESVFTSNPNYVKEFNSYKLTHKSTGAPFATETLRGVVPTAGIKDYYTLMVCWIKYGENKIMEVHAINGESILHMKAEIKPNEFPFAVLYSNEPRGGRLIGTSECAKIFANNVAYNLLDSIALTAEYRNQSPPKFVSTNSGLNIQSFAKHGHEADRTFVVNGEASRAVHYQELPQVTQQYNYIKQGLGRAMQQVTGVDDRYTGRDTGSIITTGGMEDMLNRVTLIDTPKILHYEAYAKKLTKLILANMLEFNPKRTYLVKNPTKNQWKAIEVDFPELSTDHVFQYEINVSAELPKTRQRIAQLANMLMEKQMQYGKSGQQVELITPEEWLMFQDIPNKEFFFERMGIQRNADYTEQVSAILFNYAKLVENGMNPDDAIGATADMLKNINQGEMPEESPGGVAIQQQPDAGAIPPGQQMM